MFEPEGIKLVELGCAYIRDAAFEAKRAINLRECGYIAIASACERSSLEATELAAVCHAALQFEMLAGLQ